MALSGPGDWEKELQELLDADIRGYQDPDRLRRGPGRRGTIEDDRLPAATDEPPQPPQTSDFSLFNEPRSRRDGTGETRRTLSWIWQVRLPGAKPTDSNDDILRVEWVKSRAWAARCHEELLLLQEEMRRTLVFLEKRVDWWNKQRCRRSGDKVLAEALNAYATEQVDLQRHLAEHFRALWKQPLHDAANGTYPDDMKNASTTTDADCDDDADDFDDSEEEDPDQDQGDEEEGHLQGHEDGDAMPVDPV